MLAVSCRRGAAALSLRTPPARLLSISTSKQAPHTCRLLLRGGREGAGAGRFSSPTNTRGLAGSAEASSSSSNPPRRSSPLPSLVGLTLGLVLAGGAAADLILPEYMEAENRKNALQSLQRGSYLSPDPSSPTLLAPRVALSKEIKAVVTPKVGRAGSAVVFGEQGCGKTTLVRQAVREAGEGSLYVDVGRGYADDVEEALDGALRTKAPYQSVLRAAKDEMVRTLTGAGPRIARAPPGVSAGLVRALRTLEKAADEYRALTGKAPVLLLDNVERLAKRCPEALTYLQEVAKEAAADATLSVVFVCSDGRTLREMRGKGCWSRSMDLVTVGDLSDPEALRYLVEARQMKAKDAKKAVALMGGRLVDLNKVAEAYADGDSWEAIERKALQSVEASYSLLLRLLQSDAAPLFQALLEEPSGLLSYDEVCWLTHNRAEQLLEDGGVLSLDATGWGVRFQSRTAKVYAQQCFYGSDRGPGQGEAQAWAAAGLNVAVIGAAAYWLWKGGAAAAVGPYGDQASQYVHDAASRLGRAAEEAWARIKEILDKL